MKEITIKIHAIATDGLPPKNYVSSMAFLFDGCIISGRPSPEGPDSDGQTPWIAASAVGTGDTFREVTHWVEFPVVLFRLEGEY